MTHDVYPYEKIVLISISIIKIIVIIINFLNRHLICVSILTFTLLLQLLK
jgi:hypothetical protein